MPAAEEIKRVAVGAVGNDRVRHGFAPTKSTLTPFQIPSTCSQGSLYKGELTVSRGSEGSLHGVISEIDIWRVAKLDAEVHGDKADGRSARRPEELAADGGIAGAAIWRWVTDAIGQLVNTTPHRPMH